MKKLTLWTLALALTAGAFGLQSCSDDDNDYSRLYPTALVTVKPNSDNSSFYMQLNDSTTLLPANMKASPFGKKEVRALVNYTMVDRPTMHSGRAVNINWIDSILTKRMAVTLGDKNASTYGVDPVEIVNDWVTIAEDGYLTLRFRTRWSNGSRHIVNLVATDSNKEPYKVTFYHNAQGDRWGAVGDAIVAFRLNDLPDTHGKTVDLTLEWNAYSGKKTAKFKYCTRKATNSSANIAFGTLIKYVN